MDIIVGHRHSTFSIYHWFLSRKNIDGFPIKNIGIDEEKQLNLYGIE
jgi:hypothetical protein